MIDTHFLFYHIDIKLSTIFIYYNYVTCMAQICINFSLEIFFFKPVWFLFLNCSWVMVDESETFLITVLPQYIDKVVIYITVL